ncbi:MAG: AAA family ATPase [Actinomycetota bacterium]|nr:AAA family ATPase [Actinomycetota bacterium]
MRETNDPGPSDATPPGAGGVRLAAVLMCDVDNSTRLRRRLGEERADRLWAQLQRTLRATLAGYGAEEMQSTGDGVWAVLPASSTALAAGAQLHHAVERVARRLDESLTLRVGIACGDVRPGEHDVHGLPMVQAARLVALAPPGTTLATDLTCQTAFGRGDLTFGRAQDLVLRGIDVPVPVREVAWRDAARQSRPRPPRWLHPVGELMFAGRDLELTATVDALKAAETGSSRLIVVEGEAGSGKSRLLGELARRADARDAVVLAGRCVSGGGPYQPFDDAFAQVERTAPTWLEQFAPAASPDLAAVSSVFGELDAPASRRQLDNEIGGARVRRALVSLVRSMAAVEPIVLALDDVQWAPHATLDAVRELCEALLADEDDDRCGVVIVLASRPDDGGRSVWSTMPPTLREAATRLRLSPLTSAEAASILAEVELGGWDPASVNATAGGNAFLLCELARHGRPENWGGAAPAALDSFVSRRLERLGDDATTVARCVSLDRRGLEPWLLAEACGLGVDDIDSAVTALVANGVLAERLGPPYRLAFAHDIVADVVAGQTATLWRSTRHRTIADALVTEGRPADRDPYRVAEHRLGAAAASAPADLRAALDATASAARHAGERAAHADAARWFEAALDTAGLLGDEVGLERHVRLLIGWGTSLLYSGSHDAGAVLDRAAALAREHDRGDLLGEVLLASSRGLWTRTALPDERRIAGLREALEGVPERIGGLRARLLAELAAELTWSPDGDVRFGLSDEALRLARASGDRAALAEVLVRRQLTVAAADTLDLRRRAVDELRALADELDDPTLLFQASFHEQGPALALGDTARLAALLSESRELAERLAQPQLVWLCANSEASMALLNGQLPEAEELADRARAASVDTGADIEAAAFHREQRNELLRLRGRLASQRDRFRKALGSPLIDPVFATLRYAYDAGAVEEATAAAAQLLAGDLPVRRSLAERAALDNLAYLASRIGLHEPAEQLLERLVPHGATFGHGSVVHPCGHHFIGLLRDTLGDAIGAAESFEAAAELHRERAMPLLEVESLVEWRALLVRLDRVADADALRRRAMAILRSVPAAGLEQRLG